MFDLLLFVVVWLFDRALPWSMGVGLAVWWGRNPLKFKSSRVLFLVILGLFEDISFGSILGLRSLFLISLLLIVWLISRQYQNQVWWLYIAVVLAQLSFLFLFGIHFSLWSIIVQLLFVGINQILNMRFGRDEALFLRS